MVTSVFGESWTLLHARIVTVKHHAALLQASLQSMCSPEITLLSDEGNSTLDQLANSLPGKDHMELISTFLVDHVTSPSHSYASILPALRMIATLLDHDYGFVNVKG